MKFILGEKQNMTQIFDEQGRVLPVTIIKAGPVTVTQVKTLESDGYDAVQVGYGTQKESRKTKAELGHAKAAYKVLKECRVTGEDTESITVGDVIDVSVFEPGEKVRAAAVSKGKGFQGVVKRWNFAGGPRSHGQKHNERSPGSIGATGPQEVRKGMRMAGRMGSDRVTLPSVTVVHVDAEKGELYVKGALPGRRGTLVELQGK
jgi:large subunit ribosomal protein L3